MYTNLKHFINGEWVESTGNETEDVINPATEESIGQISLGTKEDLDKAVRAAKAALPKFSRTSREERIEMLENIAKGYEKRKDELIQVMTDELGAPLKISREVHYEMGLAHFKKTAEALKDYKFEEDRGNYKLIKETIGVSGLITPWNFPTNQTSTKIASAIAAGSPMVLKPAELTPFAAMILAEIIDEAGVPKGAFNLVNGTGSTIGDGISSHPDIDFVSFTGSAGVGEKIMQNAAKTIKKVALELGGKSPLIVLDDADIEEAAKIAVSHISLNSGQVCTAATRIIIPESMKKDFEEAMKKAIPSFPVGDPLDENIVTGPLVAKKQWDRVQSYIEKGIDEGATLLTGGTGKPDGLEKGYYVKPTIFTNVSNDMVIAQEEIFGPVTAVITYKDLDEALEIANDTVYGLAGYVVGKDQETLDYVSKNIRAGQIVANDAEQDRSAPFGGFKQSGIGREWGAFGIEEYLEPKSVFGVKVPAKA
ncbi:aldehyde dehydrogenase family protein [Priestia filamentosa]|uniref:Aldehyde dehydrogenase n=1 Tax=Priestia filamentosa TaxID=1402861 RepID=A0A1X7E381_9BACI|nr:aldehyde dehydrogenase family protein [Priestia filamentosa]AKO92301.1 aldehyde dehydrogenase [Priestia filamentosa]MDT3762339.1 aldehyde dehydrogenase family protein [Priestia filamentosa]OXS68902.1 aldehyde dehydrogenase family protein [Priestia filamentosa]RJS64394.1 aldehyde dehydrogenase family protein [Priestia filamentosa]WCM17413.1 aldehyde dehydrogenase family protein [Priestia filamentosa]